MRIGASAGLSILRGGDKLPYSSFVSAEKIKRIPLRIHRKCKDKENTKRISLSPLAVSSSSSKSNPVDGEDDVFQGPLPRKRVRKALKPITPKSVSSSDHLTLVKLATNLLLSSPKPRKKKQ